MAEHLDDELRVAVLRLSRRTRLERADADVSDSQLSVLFHLWKQGPQTLGSLADLDRVTPPSMNRTVGSLAELGLVTRSASPTTAAKWSSRSRRQEQRSRRRPNGAGRRGSTLHSPA